MHSFIKNNSAILFVFALISTTLVSCLTTSFVRLNRPLTNYIRFRNLSFDVDGDKVTIVMKILCNRDSAKLDPYYVANRIATEFNDIAEKIEMDKPETVYSSDSVATTTIVSDSFQKANSFMNNIINRMKDYTTDSLKRFHPIVFNIEFIHLPNMNKSVITYSRELFEKNGIIAFKSHDGKLNLNFISDSAFAEVRTNGDNFTDLRVNSSDFDSIQTMGTEIIAFDYDKKAKPWYSWTNISNFFSIGNKSTTNDLPPSMNSKGPNGFWLFIFAFFQGSNAVITYIAGLLTIAVSWITLQKIVNGRGAS